MMQRPCPWIKKRRHGQSFEGRGAMVSPALIQITVMSFIREYVSKRLRPQVVAMKCASGLLLLLWRRRYTSQPVVDRNSVRFSFHGVVKEPIKCRQRADQIFASECAMIVG